MHERNIETALLDMWDTSGLVQRSSDVRATPLLKETCLLLDFALAEAIATASADAEVQRDLAFEEPHETILNVRITSNERAN